MSQIKPAYKPKLIYIINVDWYFLLHWQDRAKAAIEQGYEVHLATSISADNLNQLKTLDITIHNIEIGRKSLNPFTNVKSFVQIYNLLRTIRPELIHCATIKPNIFGCIAARLLKIRTVASVTGLGTIYYEKNFRFKVTRYLVNKLYRFAFSKKASIVLFENNHDMNYMVSNNIVSKNNVDRIYGSGVDIATFPYIKEDTTAPIIVLFASRLLQSKGLEELVEAVNNAHLKGINIKLLIAGIIDSDTVEAINVSTVEKWAHQEHINWLGECKNIPELIASSNIVVLPNRYGEGIPRILLEAGACGRAVITTNTPGSNELITHKYNGLLIDPNNVEQLTAAIITLAENHTLRSELANNGKKRIMNHYTKESVIEKTLSSYSKIMSLE